jgi:sec-independent protein translocase protein TatB
MFGMSFGELAVVIIVGLIVMGPKELPKVLRKLGLWAGKLRRMAADLRAQSGIDDALRDEGLDFDIREIRKLARGEIDGVMRREPPKPIEALATSEAPLLSPPSEPIKFRDLYVASDRENPREGPDSYGALPDTSIVYENTLPKSALADDPLYVLGDASAKLPERGAPAEPNAAASAPNAGNAE